MDGAKRQQRIEATRGHLMTAARQMFLDRGYQGASVAAITEAAGFSHGTFYLYFRNKEDVFAEVMREMLDDLLTHAFTPFDELGDRYDADRNQHRIAAFIEAFAVHGRLWRSLLEAVLVSPTIEAAWLEHRNLLHVGLADRIRRYQAAGDLPPYDADEMAYVLGGMLEWYAFTGAAFGTPRPLSPLSTDVVALISGMWGRALGAPDAPPAGPLPADAGPAREVVGDGPVVGVVGGSPSA